MVLKTKLSSITHTLLVSKKGEILIINIRIVIKKRKEEKKKRQHQTTLVWTCEAYKFSQFWNMNSESIMIKLIPSISCLFLLKDWCVNLRFWLRHCLWNQERHIHYHHFCLWDYLSHIWLEDKYSSTCCLADQSFLGYTHMAAEIAGKLR